MSAQLSLVNTETGEIAAADFSDFWLLYPRRVAKKDALKAWARMTPNQQMAALTACVNWRRVWANKDIDYLPYPATWLNGERWDDELPPEYTRTAASHMPAQLPAAGERTQMPEHVRALLAKMRGKA